MATRLNPGLTQLQWARLVENKDARIAELEAVVKEAKRIFGNALVLSMIGRDRVPDEELPEGMRAFFAKADAALKGESE